MMGPMLALFGVACWAVLVAFGAALLDATLYAAATVLGVVAAFHGGPRK
jgi:hypothetical protein